MSLWYSYFLKTDMFNNKKRLKYFRQSSSFGTTVFQGLKWPPFFVVYCLMVILIEK